MTMPIDSFRNPVGNDLAKALKTTRSEINKLTLKQTSGQQYLDLRELSDAGLAGEYTSSIIKLQEITSLETTSKTTTALLTAQKDAVASIREAAITVRDDIISNFSDPAKIPDIINNAISQIQNLLNSQRGSECLFGGSNSSLPLVDLTLTSIVNGMTSTNYSSATSVNKTIKITPNQSLNIGLDANNKAFEELIGALHVMRDSADYDADYPQFMDLIENSLDKLTNLEVQLVDNLRIVEEANTQNSIIKTSVTELIEDLFVSDPIALKVQIEERNTALQVIMIAISNLTKLSLADYIQ